MPTPLRAIVWLVPAMVEGTDTMAERAPTAVGAKAIEMSHVAPGNNVALEQVSPSLAKSPALAPTMPTLPNTSLTLPALVILRVVAGLLDPIAWLAKVVVKLRLFAGATPVRLGRDERRETEISDAAGVPVGSDPAERHSGPRTGSLRRRCR